MRNNYSIGVSWRTNNICSPLPSRSSSSWRRWCRWLFTSRSFPSSASSQSSSTGERRRRREGRRRRSVRILFLKLSRKKWFFRHFDRPKMSRPHIVKMCWLILFFAGRPSPCTHLLSPFFENIMTTGQFRIMKILWLALNVVEHFSAENIDSLRCYEFELWWMCCAIINVNFCQFEVQWLEMVWTACTDEHKYIFLSFSSYCGWRSTRVGAEPTHWLSRNLDRYTVLLPNDCNLMIFMPAEPHIGHCFLKYSTLYRST